MTLINSKLIKNIRKKDIILYNSAGDSFDPKASYVNAVLYSSGDVSYIPPGMFKATCQINIEEFPFDEQSCGLKFGRYRENNFNH